jgi:hypothetical protein
VFYYTLYRLAIGVIAARLIAPGSERSAHVWLQDVTALDDLLGADFVNLSRDRVYKTADMLLRRRSEIEAHLRGREQSLFQLRETLILYDLTNTFFEGTGKYNGKAHFGHSREKRTDCPLVTLGLVLDAGGFPKRSGVFDGNVSEAGTLEGMIAALSTACLLLKPLIVVDAGIGTQKNLDWFKEHGYGYLAVSRKRKIDVPSSLEMVTVREDKRRLIRAALINNPDAGEIELYCPGLSCAARHSLQVGQAGNNAKLVHDPQGALYTHAHHHHHEKRRRQNDPHSQIDPAGTFPRSDL